MANTKKKCRQGDRAHPILSLAQGWKQTFREGPEIQTDKEEVLQSKKNVSQLQKAAEIN